MEGAGAESISPYDPFLQTTDGGACWYAHLHRNMVHPVLLLPLAGCDDALRLVAAAVGIAETHVRYPYPMGLFATHSHRPAPADEHGSGLLDLFTKTARALLSHHHRHRCGCSPSMGLSLPARQVLATGCMAIINVRYRLPTDRYLWLGGKPADGHLVVAAHASQSCCNLLRNIGISCHSRSAGLLPLYLPRNQSSQYLLCRTSAVLHHRRISPLLSTLLPVSTIHGSHGLSLKKESGVRSQERRSKE